MNATIQKEISCRVTRTLLMYVREVNGGTLGTLLEGLELDESYLADPNNWVSHAFLQELYRRMVELLEDPDAVYKMAFATAQFKSAGLLDRMVRLVGNPRMVYALAPKYNKLLKANGEMILHRIKRSSALIEDRYHSSRQKTPYDCDYTRGVLAAIPTIYGLPPARVEELECQVLDENWTRPRRPDHLQLGRRGCLYRVQWSPAALFSFVKRIFDRHHIYRNAIDDLQEANRLIQDKYAEVRRLANRLEQSNQELIRSRAQLEAYTAELEASEKRYRLLAENVTDTIWTMDLATLKFTYISPSVLKMRGYTAQEAMALGIEETLTPDSVEKVTRILTEELAREANPESDPNRSRTIEVQQICKDGSVGWAEVTTTLTRNEAGQPVGILGITRDISERKQAEALYQEKIAAQAANQAKSEFLANMSHELRTPLNHIIGFTELVVHGHVGELNSEQGEYLRDALAGSRHLLSLINDILDLSKVEAGKMELALETIDLAQLLEGCLNTAKKSAAQAHIDFGLRLDELPPSFTADGRKLRQILDNLLSNAVKFTPRKGSVTLRARSREFTDGVIAASDGRLFRLPAHKKTLACRPSKGVEISVRDTGIGLDPEMLEPIFYPFAQVETSRSRKFQGTGLGLALTRNFVELHGGVIWAESAGADQGSTFCFILPIPSDENRNAP